MLAFLFGRGNIVSRKQTTIEPTKPHIYMNKNKPPVIGVESIANPHCHLREDGAIVASLVEKAIEGGVDALGPMPNTSAGLLTADQVSVYISRAGESIVPGEDRMSFIPICMITEGTTVKNILDCMAIGIDDFKIYPRFRTTKSENGVMHYAPVISVVREASKIAMERFGRPMKIHLHPEHPCETYGNREAELVFTVILRMFLEETEKSGALIISEHGTDAECIPHWRDMAVSGRFSITLTAHHLAANEDKTLGDVRSVCKPPIKREVDRQALVKLVGEDLGWVVAGADDAPHDKGKKHVHEGTCACGAYTSPFLLPLYAHALDNLLATPKGVETFVNFTSRNARKLHGLQPASRKIELIREPFKIPYSYNIGSWVVEPFWAGQEIKWSFAP